jgi:hypothetical protein
MLPSSIREIPGYAEAVERESMLRESVFVFDGPRDIFGFPISVFTLRHYLTLKLIASPFLTGRTPSPEDLHAALWLLNPAHGSPQALAAHVRRCRSFIPPSQPASRWWLIQAVWRRQYVQRLAAAAEITDKLREVINESLMDFPGGSGRNATSYYGDGAYICGVFAYHFKWFYLKTLATPMSVILQELKVIADLNGSKAPKFNPSDLVAGRWLKEQNAAKRN